MTTSAPALWRAGERCSERSSECPGAGSPGPAFPERLANISTPPKVLYTIGDRALVDMPCVAIVGTRHPSAYGERVTHQLATALVEAGACIVSGMAAGIDGCAHRAALQAKGSTIAVLGAGIDQIYPPRHEELYHTIAQRGLIVAEYPPGHGAFRGCFPRRNRLIAALAAFTIVVEAGLTSGSLITASYALDQGKTVAAVPGRIDAVESKGSNQLLRDGAHVIASIDDALALFAMAGTPAKVPDVALEGDDATLWAAIADHPQGDKSVSIDDLVAQSAIPANRALAALTSLEIRGLVQALPTGEVRRA